ncbi:type III secretion system export apparatus subunit SctT [Thalassoglobus sp. JC818]|uniref:type III secretion system export apparatus subunit SctT n=1 Tax=Thalassoglobus sp. JC818 TaxID=3232136 RepID=UPI00345B3421
MSDLILESFRSLFVTAVLSVTRMTVASLTVPFMGGDSIQLPVRASIIASLGLILYPIVGPTLPVESLAPLELVSIFLKEALLGLMLGFLASKLFWVALGIGMVIDNQRGASIAESLDPNTNEQVSPLGQLMQQALIALFYTSGGYLLFLTAMFQSYIAWPIFTCFPTFASDFPTFFLGHVDDVMKMTVILASPLLITLFISEFGLGLINRFAPQLNVFFLAMPLKSLVAFIVLIFYFPYLVNFLLTDSTSIEHIVDSLKAVVK